MTETGASSAPGDPAETVRIPLRIIFLAAGLSGFGPLCIDMYLPAFPRIGHDLRASASAVELSFTACLIGLGLGQIVIGPLSDRFGRRRPLFVGLAAFIVASCACALAPNIETLVALRFVQGIGGSAGVVISLALVRDQYSGPTAARFFSFLLLVTALGPILAPQLGALILTLGSWRVLFLVLGAIGVALLVNSVLRLPETLPPEARNPGNLAAMLAAMRGVAADRNFLVNAMANAFGFGAVFAYVSGSSFVVENVYGLSPQLFSLVFGFNAVGLSAASQVNARLIPRFGSRALLTTGLLALAGASVVLLVLTLTHSAPLFAFIACTLIVMSSIGFVGPNATALALNDFPQAAGSASALVGFLRYSAGAAVAPLVGLAGPRDALPLTIVMTTCSLIAFGLRLGLRPRPAARPVARLIPPPGAEPAASAVPATESLPQ